MSPSKILFLVEAENDYYFSMAAGLGKGFQKLGVDYRMLDVHMPDDTLRSRIESLKPDVIFEINRTRRQSNGLIPDEVLHICWIQDAWKPKTRAEAKRLHRRDPRFGGSDLIYTLLSPNYFGLTPKSDDGMRWGILHTGVDSEVFDLRNTPIEPNLATICGYIPPPAPVMAKSLNLDLPLMANGDRQITPRALIDELQNKAGVSVGKHTLSDIHRIITDAINRHLGCTISVDQMLDIFNEHWFLLVLDTELPRIPDRYGLACAALNAGLKLELYGPPTWQEWVQLRSHYRANVLWPSELAQIYRRSQFNLHNGAFGMHSRVLEAMSCGGAVFANHTSLDDSGRDLPQQFTEGEHFIAYSPESVGDVLAHWKNGGTALRDIGMNAAAAIRKGHQWHHRAEQVLRDLSGLQAGRQPLRF